MTKNYLWTENPTEANVAVYDPDILNECLMHLKYNADKLTKFCINSASTDANGNPNLLSYSGNIINFNCGNSIVPTMTSNTQDIWTLRANHSLNSASNDVYKSYNKDSLTYCSLKHTPSLEDPATITLEKTSAFSFDYLFLKFNSVLNPGSAKSFYIEDGEGNLLFSYDNFGEFLDKDEFLIPIYSFNSTKLVISITSNVNGVDYVNFPSIIKLLDRYQIVSLTNAKGSSYLLSQINSLTFSNNGTYNIYLAPDGSAEILATPLTVGKVFPTSPSLNQVHYLTNGQPAIAKKYNGSLWMEYDRVPAGKVVVANGAITSIVQPVYNQNAYDITLPMLNKISGYRMIDYSKVIQAGIAINQIYQHSVDTKLFGTIYTAECNALVYFYYSFDNTTWYPILLTYIGNITVHYPISGIDIPAGLYYKFTTNDYRTGINLNAYAMKGAE